MQIKTGFFDNRFVFPLFMLHHSFVQPIHFIPYVFVPRQNRIRAKNFAVEFAYTF